jgi:hypothetical protein
MMSEIEVQRDLFQRWFKRPLADLYNNPDAGFIVLITTLPLIERYLREKTNNHQEHLQDDFHAALVQMLPNLSDIPTSRKFWKLYRHGMLHRASLKLEADVLEVGIDERTAAHGIVTVSYDAQGYKFRIAAVEFSKLVIETIENDFTTFAGDNSGTNPLMMTSAGYSGSKKPEGLVQELSID